MFKFFNLFLLTCVGSVIVMLFVSENTSKANEQLNDRKVFSQSQTIANDSIEQTVLDKVTQLPEVLAIANYIDSTTNGARGVTIIVKHRPDKENCYYHIQVGFNSPDRLIIYYNFYIKSDDMQINYYDNADDTIIPIEEWRRKMW